MPVNFLSSDFMEWFRFQIFYTISRQCSKIFPLVSKIEKLQTKLVQTEVKHVMKCQAYVILLSKPSCISLLTFKGLRRKTCQIWKKYEINTNKSLCTYAYKHVHTHTHTHTPFSAEKSKIIHSVWVCLWSIHETSKLLVSPAHYSKYIWYKWVIPQRIL